ncbi:MAG TPA: extracellular solute-binding protein, partial [Chloroflexota bacterium]|nr:extracellular solute-binding protein [Chloroflexota bacterium]
MSQRITRRATLAPVLAVSTAAALAACSQPAETPAGPGAAPDPVPVLHWFNYAVPHRFGLAQQAVLDDFHTRNPGRVQVEIGEAGGTVALAKLKTAVAAGTPPTMWFSWQVEASDLLSMGAVTDLNAPLKTHKEWGKLKGDLIPTLLDGASWRGKLTLMPLFPDPHGLGFNKHLLQASATPLPSASYTWNDFIDIGRRAAQPPDRVLFDFQYTWSYFYRWMFANGQRPLNADRTRVTLDTPAMLEMLQWCHDQVTKGVARNGGANFDAGASLTEIINTGTVIPPRYPNVDPGDGSGIHLINYPHGPSNSRKEIGTPGNVFGFIVLKGADPKSEAGAAEIAAWSVRPDVQLKVAEVSGHAPASLAAARDPNLARSLKDNPLLKALNDLARYNYPTPNLPSWNNAQTVINDTLAHLGTSAITPRAALAELQARIQP